MKPVIDHYYYTVESPYLQYSGQHDKRGVLQLHLNFAQPLCDVVVCSHTVGKDESIQYYTIKCI